MQSTLVFLLLQTVAVYHAAIIPPTSMALRAKSNIKPMTDWNAYKSYHGKRYSGQVDQDKKAIFEKNVQAVSHHNMLYDLGLKSFKMAINRFSDWKQEQYAERAGLVYNRTNIQTKNASAFLAPSFVEPPAELDWRKYGYVTPVEDQGECDSGYAFSAAGALEGQHFRKTGQLVSLSAQQLVDCSVDFVDSENKACEGGWAHIAFQYLETRDGIDSDSAYPYDGKFGECRVKEDGIVATVTGYDVAFMGSESDLLMAVATAGPVAVMINASLPSFRSYSNGVYDDPDCGLGNHGVLIVGYGTENGKDYWLVKNSWGEKWGDGGYIKMARNKDSQCGITYLATFPQV